MLRPPNQELLAHERKRQVEIRCLELEDRLREESNDLDDAAIFAKVAELRATLLAELATASGPGKADIESKSLKSHEVHLVSEAKAAANSRFESAFGITKDFTEGGSFDKQRLELLRLERIAKRERREKELEEHRAQLERNEKDRRERMAKEAADHHDAAHLDLDLDPVADPVALTGAARVTE
eukprot:jgi/Hompol1/6560/HPOL_000750-RA